MYLELGRYKEASGDMAEAEEAYLEAQAPGAAISLYKKRVRNQKSLYLCPSSLPGALLPAASGPVRLATVQPVAFFHGGRRVCLQLAQCKWDEALRLAKRFQPSEVQHLLMQQAKAKVAAEDLEVGGSWSSHKTTIKSIHCSHNLSAARAFVGTRRATQSAFVCDGEGTV